MQSLLVVALSLADVTGDVNGRKKIHFDFDNPGTLAFFAAPAFDVEAKTPFVKAAKFGFLGTGKEGPNIIKKTDVGSWVTPGGAADRALIDQIDTFEVVVAVEPVVGTDRIGPGAVEIVFEGGIECFGNQGAFATPGDAGNTDKIAKREIESQIFEVVGASANKF